MRLNSSILAVTIMAQVAHAWATLSRSLLPIGLSADPSSSRTPPYSVSAARRLVTRRGIDTGSRGRQDQGQKPIPGLEEDWCLSLRPIIRIRQAELGAEFDKYPRTRGLLDVDLFPNL